MKIALSIVMAVVLSGCASKATSIEAAYVSPIGYQALTCPQIAAEAQTVSARAHKAVGAQNKKASDDAALMAVGIVIFWPALLFTSGDGASAAEVSRLKGEMQALKSASDAKGCGLQIQTI